MIGVHAARLATLELEEDIEFARILQSTAAIVLVIYMSCRSATLKTVVCMCKNQPSTLLTYEVRLTDSKPKVFQAAHDISFIF